MRYDSAGYSTRAGRDVNCDAMMWMERGYGISAALCSAANASAASVSAARLSALRLSELADEVLCREDAEKLLRQALKETGGEGIQHRLFAAAMVALRDKTVFWAGIGSAGLAVFSDGKVKRFGDSPEIVSAEFELAPGDALVMGSRGFFSHVDAMECMIDRHKSKDAAQWMDYLLLRNIERSQLEGDSISVWLCIAEE